ncbi:MAG: hypothetical protein N3G20_02275 [Verrucomicrobiae bacterium]|nr:hypothetical protein [Verrucomicrobiae bacterium]
MSGYAQKHRRTKDTDETLNAFNEAIKIFFEPSYRIVHFHPRLAEKLRVRFNFHPLGIVVLFGLPDGINLAHEVLVSSSRGLGSPDLG